jgi:hypothetical protein
MLLEVRLDVPTVRSFCSIFVSRFRGFGPISASLRTVGSLPRCFICRDTRHFTASGCWTCCPEDVQTALRLMITIATYDDRADG